MQIVLIAFEISAQRCVHQTEFSLKRTMQMLVIIAMCPISAFDASNSACYLI